VLHRTYVVYNIYAHHRIPMYTYLREFNYQRVCLIFRECHYFIKLCIRVPALRAYNRKRGGLYYKLKKIIIINNLLTPPRRIPIESASTDDAPLSDYIRHLRVPLYYYYREPPLAHVDPKINTNRLPPKFGNTRERERERVREK
jgi:hypothetical protein